MSYYLAPSLVALRTEINNRWPNRNTSADGWIGDASHAARPSDHNPDWSSGGVVRAIDVTCDGIDRKACLKAIIGDPRVWYVISNGIIYSRTYGWTARRYTGSNPHNHHFHVSILHSQTAERDLSPWLSEAASLKVRTKNLPTVNLKIVREQATKPTRKRPGVRRIQRALNARYRARLPVDGWFGPKTRHAYAHHMKAVKAKGRSGIPTRYSLTELGRGRFRVVPKK